MQINVVIDGTYRSSSWVRAVRLAAFPLDYLRTQGEIFVLPVTTLINFFGVCFLTHLGKVSFRDCFRANYEDIAGYGLE